MNLNRKRSVGAASPTRSDGGVAGGPIGNAQGPFSMVPMSESRRETVHCSAVGTSEERVETGKQILLVHVSNSPRGPEKMGRSFWRNIRGGVVTAKFQVVRPPGAAVASSSCRRGTGTQRRGQFQRHILARANGEVALRVVLIAGSMETQDLRPLLFVWGEKGVDNVGSAIS